MTLKEALVAIGLSNLKIPDVNKLSETGRFFFEVATISISKFAESSDKLSEEALDNLLKGATYLGKITIEEKSELTDEEQLALSTELLIMTEELDKILKDHRDKARIHYQAVGPSASNSTECSNTPIDTELKKLSNSSNPSDHMSPQVIAAGVFVLGIVSFAIASAVTGNVAGFMNVGSLTRNCLAALGVVMGASSATYCIAYHRNPPSAGSDENNFAANKDSDEFKRDNLNCFG